MIFYLKGNDSQRICSHEDRRCASKTVRMFKQETSDEYKKSDCLPECDFIDYNYEIIYERMISDKNDAFQNICYSASIYFGSDEFLAYKRYESYGTVGLLSKIGGLLGLFLGLSVMSIIETIYFFTLRFLSDLWLKN